MRDELVCVAARLPHVVAAALSICQPRGVPEQARAVGGQVSMIPRVIRATQRVWRDIRQANGAAGTPMDELLAGLARLTEAGA